MPPSAWPCATAVLLLALLTGAAALLDVPVSPDDATTIAEEEGKDWLRGRVLGASSAAVFTRRLAGVPGSGALLARLARNLEDVVSGGYNCAVRDTEAWSAGMQGFAAARGWPQPDTGCVSSVARVSGVRGNNVIKTEPAEAIGESFRFVEMIGKVKEGVVRELGRVADPEKVDEFTSRGYRSKHEGKPVESFEDEFRKPVVGAHWNYTADTVGRLMGGSLRYKECRLERLTGVRYKRGKEARAQWYFLSSVTNAKQDADLADKLRFYVSEYVGVDGQGEFVDPLTMNLRSWNGDLGKRQGMNRSEILSEPRQKFSTAFERWGGRVSLSAVHSLPEEDSPALLLALGKSDVAAGQAEDALTPSNIGILALPMALNIIPFAIFADVSSVGLFVYTIMTDILTCVPFIIKGFELYHAGSQNFAAQETWFTGEKRPRGPHDPIRALGGWVVAESWNASCFLSELRDVGTIFIGVGFSLLFFGVFLEWQAQRLRRKWIANGTLIPFSHQRLAHEQLKADTLEPDLRGLVGLNPIRTSDLDVADEEQNFLDNQVVCRPPVAATNSRWSNFSSGSSERKRTLRLSGRNSR